MDLSNIFLSSGTVLIRFLIDLLNLILTLIRLSSRQMIYAFFVFFFCSGILPMKSSDLSSIPSSVEKIISSITNVDFAFLELALSRISEKSISCHFSGSVIICCTNLGSKYLFKSSSLASSSRFDIVDEIRSKYLAFSSIRLSIS